MPSRSCRSPCRSRLPRSSAASTAPRAPRPRGALPALAALITIPLGMVRRPPLDAEPALIVQTLTSLAQGFILTSLLWGAALAALIDGHSRRAAAYVAVAGVLALLGVI